MSAAKVTQPRRAAHPGSDAELVQRCLEGDRRAWEVLIRTYWRQVFNVAYKFVARYGEAEDLTQDIFVKLFESLPKYDGRANFETWLMRIARNHSIDRYRRRRREAKKVTDDIDPDALSFEELVFRPDAALEQREDVATVRRALAKVSATYREPVVLRDLHELSYEEIARRLQLPEGTVKSRINRGRRELAKHLRVLQGLEREDSNRRRQHRQEAAHANR